MERMDRERNFWVVGGDQRQQALVRLLRDDGHTVHLTALEDPGAEPLGPGVSLAHCVILPLPVTGQGGAIHAPLSRSTVTLPSVLRCMEPGQILCGGMVSKAVRRAGKERGLRVFDYYAREECMVTNAVPTAEGAVQVAMEELPITLHNAHRMGVLGAKVTVAARDYEDLAWASAYGYEAAKLETLSYELGGMDLVVNTIPAQVLDARRLSFLNPEAFILDLASSPGGVDREAALALGLRVLQAPGLPGRTAPVTAAAAIRDAVYHILWELEETS